MQRTLLVKNAHMLVTMDAQRREIADGGMFIEGNRIVAVVAERTSCPKPPTKCSICAGIW